MDLIHRKFISNKRFLKSTTKIEIIIVETVDNKKSVTI